MSEAPADLGPTTQAFIKDSRRITPERSEEVRHITLQVADPAFQFVEGQSIGVVVPGPHPFGNPTMSGAIRLPMHAAFRSTPGLSSIFWCVAASISTRSAASVIRVSPRTICAMRSRVPALTISGPYLSPFKMPLDNRANLLMIGTGTGIAPFRAFAQLIYERRGDWKGQVRLYYGGRSGLGSHVHQRRDHRSRQLLRREDLQGVQGARHASLDDLLAGIGARSRRQRRGCIAPHQRAQHHVFLSGLGKIAAVFDKVMAERVGSSEGGRRSRRR
jgi:ferredoxin--NADP+ reductase